MVGGRAANKQKSGWPASMQILEKAAVGTMLLYETLNLF